MPSLSTFQYKLYPFFNQRKNTLRESCFKKKFDNVDFLYATYIVLNVNEVYVTKYLMCVLKSDWAVIKWLPK